ncbi:MAG: methyltransferase, partial [Xanthomonadales bacterium]|nr:methyltransferase [Xanthomonadales bacterium]
MTTSLLLLTLLTGPNAVYEPGAVDMAAAIEAAAHGDHRSESNRDRNRYRHPVGTLMFFGLEPDMRVIEIWPGGGWYTEVLAPVLRENGQFVAAGWDPAVEGQADYRYRLHDELHEKFAANPEIYGKVEYQPFSPPASASLGEPDSADMVVTFRNNHGWIGNDLADTMYAEFFRVLKPGGILGVV